MNIKTVNKTVDDIMELYPDMETKEQIEKTVEWLKDNEEQVVCNDN